MERAIEIIKREIEKRKSMLLNEEHFLRTNQIKCEIESLNKALEVVNKNDLLQRVSNSEERVAVCTHDIWDYDRCPFLKGGRDCNKCQWQTDC